MNKYLLVSLSLIAGNAFSESTDNTKMYSLANNVMDVVSHTKEFPGDGHFELNQTQSDLVLNLAAVDNAIGNYLTTDSEKKDCEEKKPLNLNLEKNFEKRSFRVGAVGVLVLDDFKPMQKITYGTKPYDDYMTAQGKSTAGTTYDWNNLTKRIANYNPDGNIEENAQKIAGLLKKETGIDAPQGVIASELVYRKLLSKPDEWNESLKQAGGLLSFDEKVALVAKLGERFASDYNVERSGGGNGFIPIEVLLKNISLPEAGGVCRDIALAQTQMMKALGVKESYSVAYSTIGGGHATMIAVDPNDKNRFIKINYYLMDSDDGKKGTMALEQNDTLPDTGINYRIYNSEGKPLASVPTELGKILKDVTGQEKKPGDFMNTSSLYKIKFDNDKVNGTLFAGMTSKGEKIYGAALNKSFTTPNLDFKVGGSAFTLSTEKQTYDLVQTGAYFYGAGDAKYPVYDGEYGKLTSSVGVKAEFLLSSVKTTKSNSESSDVAMYFNSKTTYELPLNGKSSASLAAVIEGRDDKSNVADEGTKHPQYDSTIFISKYEYRHTPDIKTTVEMAAAFNKYGNNYSMKTSLEDKSNKLSVMGNLAGRAPSFFPGQQDAMGVSYERISTKNGWNFLVEYQKNFSSGAHSFQGKARKDF